MEDCLLHVNSTMKRNSGTVSNSFCRAALLELGLYSQSSSFVWEDNFFKPFDAHCCHMGTAIIASCAKPG